MMMNVVTEFARGCVLIELLYVDDFLLMSETIEGLGIKFLKWNEALESTDLNINLGKTKVIVGSGVTKDDLSSSNIALCGSCRLRVMVNSVLCVVW